SWRLHDARQWRWGMAPPAVGSFQIHPHPSQAAFWQLMGDWAGLLVRDGSRVSQAWEGLRPRGFAPLCPGGTGLGERVEAGMARCGRRVHAEVQWLGHMKTERPTIGQWRAW